MGHVHDLGSCVLDQTTGRQDLFVKKSGRNEAGAVSVATCNLTEIRIWGRNISDTHVTHLAPFPPPPSSRLVPIAGFLFSIVTYVSFKQVGCALSPLSPGKGLRGEATPIPPDFGCKETPKRRQIPKNETPYVRVSIFYPSSFLLLTRVHWCAQALNYVPCANPNEFKRHSRLFLLEKCPCFTWVTELPSSVCLIEATKPPDSADTRLAKKNS